MNKNLSILKQIQNKKHRKRSPTHHHSSHAKMMQTEPLFEKSVNPPQNFDLAVKLKQDPIDCKYFESPTTFLKLKT